MKVLIVIKRSPAQIFLVNLNTSALVREFSAYLGKGNNAQAMVVALTKGKIERLVGEDELPGVKAEAIITEESARWDLMG